MVYKQDNLIHFKNINYMFDNTDKEDEERISKEPFLTSTADLQELAVDALSGDQNGQTSSHHKHSKANFLLSTCILIKSTIGAGILSLPYVIDQMGIIMTIICYIIACLLHQYSSIILLHAKNMSGRSNIATIMNSIHPNDFSKAFVSGLISLGTMGVSQNLLLKQTIRKVMVDTFSGRDFLSSFFTNQKFIVIVLSALWLPLIFTSKIQQLKIFSMIGVLGVIVFVITFITFFNNQLNQNIPLKPLNLLPSNWLAAFSTVPNVIFSIGFFMNFFSIYKGLQDANDRKMNRLVCTGINVCSIIYITIGVMGRLLIGSEITPNLLNSIKYSQIGTTLYIIMYCSFLLSLFFSFPVIFFACKNNVICLLRMLIPELNGRYSYVNPNHIKLNQSRQLNESQLEQKAYYEKRQRFIFICGILVIFILIETISILFNNVQIVFNFIGAITSPSINILLPNYFYFRLVALNSFRKGWKYYFSMCLLVVMIPFCMFQIVSLYIK